MRINFPDVLAPLLPLPVIFLCFSCAIMRLLPSPTLLSLSLSLSLVRACLDFELRTIGERVAAAASVAAGSSSSRRTHHGTSKSASVCRASSCACVDCKRTIAAATAAPGARRRESAARTVTARTAGKAGCTCTRVRGLVQRSRPHTHSHTDLLLPHSGSVFD